jgi:hypothetical protein
MAGEVNNGADQRQSELATCAGNRAGFSSTFGELTGRLKTRAQQMKEQEPLRLLGVIATLGLALGIAVRLWRSRYA